MGRGVADKPGVVFIFERIITSRLLARDNVIDGFRSV